MDADRTPRYGRVHFNPGWYAVIVSLMFLAAFGGTVLVDFDKPAVVPVMGWFLGVFAVAMNWKAILRIPAVETGEEGITLRNWSGLGRVFVRWEDAEGVVIWHVESGVNGSTMVAVAAREGFEYDNYGIYRPIRRTRNPLPGSKVKRRLRSWSVNVGRTSPRKIARLVNASGKGVTVVEELPSGDTWNHSGPQWGA